MPDPLVLTFAEIEFLLRARPPVNVAVRELLDLGPEEDADVAAKAGLSSLLARGLCTPRTDEVELATELRVLMAGLATATIGTRALGWHDGQKVLVHIFVGPTVNLALFASQHGRFTVRRLDSAVSMLDQLTRFVDTCLPHDSRNSVVIQSITKNVRVGIAVAADEHGKWFVSDSESVPHKARPSSRARALARLGELLPT
ncbi:MAG TPA: hypothetical protein VGD67_24795 [Pseudonocardiaceae bacterium]